MPLGPGWPAVCAADQRACFTGRSSPGSRDGRADAYADGTAPGPPSGAEVCSRPRAPPVAQGAGSGPGTTGGPGGTGGAAGTCASCDPGPAPGAVDDAPGNDPE